MPDNPPADLLPVLETMTRYWRTEHDRGRQWLYRRPSMAAGVIRGGIKVNVVPRRCEVEVDCRLPFGITPDDIRREVEGRLAAAGLRRVRFESMPPVFTPATRRPTHRWCAWPGPTPTAATGKRARSSRCDLRRDRRPLLPTARGPDIDLRPAPAQHGRARRVHHGGRPGRGDEGPPRDGARRVARKRRPNVLPYLGGAGGVRGRG